MRGEIEDDTEGEGEVEGEEDDVKRGDVINTT